MREDRLLPWLTIVPIDNSGCLPEDLAMPFSLGPRVTIARLPEWLADHKSQNPQDRIWPRFVESLDTLDGPCFLVSYDAKSLGDPDPTWTEPRPRAIQESAFEEVLIAFFSIWLRKPTALRYGEVAHVENNADEWLFRQLFAPDAPTHIPSDGGNQLEVKDLETARVIATTLRTLPRSSVAWTAAGLSIRALTEPEWDVRYLLFWIVLESLFGPLDAREMTFRIAQRVALFLGKDANDSQDLFSKIKSSYAWRSKIVHGLRLSKLTEEEANSQIELVQRVVRDSVVMILSDPAMLERIGGNQRENFLDGLAFK